MTRKIPRKILNAIMAAKYSKPSFIVDISKNPIDTNINTILTESQPYAV